MSTNAPARAVNDPKWALRRILGTVSPLQLYISAVILAGVPSFFYCLNSAVQTARLDWLYFGALVLATSFFPITIPSAKLEKQSLSFTVCDVFVFTSLILYSPEVAALLALLDATLNNIRSKVCKPYKQFFNLSQVCISTLVAGKLFYFLLGTSAPLHLDTLESPFLLLLYIDLSGLVYFLLSSGAVAVAIGLATKRPLLKVWNQDALWTSLATVAGVSLAAPIFLVFEHLGFLTFALAILPVLVVVYGTFRLISQRVIEANRHLHEVGELHRSTISSLALAIDAKDECTNGHVHRVQAIALGLAEFAGVNGNKELEGLWAAALLHDIGKLATPEFVLNKPTSLTEWEMKTMRQHAAAGERILSSIPFPYPVANLVRHHHEKWNGQGYPDGLKGEEIPLGSRIIAIADCYDALTSDRPYRPKLDRGTALGVLTSEAGQSYDPKLVEVLVRNVKELDALIDDIERRLPPPLCADFVPQADIREGVISETLFFDLAVSQAKVLQSMSSSVQGQHSLMETLEVLCKEIGRMIDFQAAVIYLLEARSDRLHPFYVTGTGSKSLKNVVLRLGEGITGWVAANRQPLFNVSPAPDFVGKQTFLPLFKTCLAIPLALNGQVVGTISLYSKRENAYADVERHSLDVLSRLAVVAVNNALMQEELTKHRIHLHPVRRVGT